MEEPMPKGISLHIGLNAIDPKHYQGWDDVLQACELDAKDMAAIANSRGFKSTQLLTKQATRDAVLKGIGAAARSLAGGDIFFLSYSGHGGQLPDQNGDEPDGLDETWCLFDGELVDDELNDQLANFKSGVRILVLSDSCHSGTVLKMALMAAPETKAKGTVYRAMPGEVAQRTYLAHQKFYDKILKNPKLANAEDRVKASATLISGCQDNQLSSDGTFNGLFTGTLKTVWNGGKFKGNYEQFHHAIAVKMPSDQTPNLFKVGAPNPKFDDQVPFAIEDGRAKSR